MFSYGKNYEKESSFRLTAVILKLKGSPTLIYYESNPFTNESFYTIIIFLYSSLLVR